MPILYEKETGKAVSFAYEIDVRESLATGFYLTEDPSKKRVPIEKVEKVSVVEEKVEIVKPKPIKPKVIQKKGISKRTSK